MSRVLQIPADHPYVDRCAPSATSVRPNGIPAPGSDQPWAPSPGFDPAWLAAHVDQIDVVHLHFGFDHLTPDELAGWVQALDRAGLPLVLTLHDLRNPHHDSPERHDAHLDVLVPAAAAVLTLTDAAAAVVQRRWHRAATVLPHPHVADLSDLAARPPRGTAGRLAGIHLKDLRRNVVEPARLVAAAAKGAADAGGRLRVDLHPGVLGRPELAEVRDLAAVGAIDLHPHSRFSDSELIGYLAGLDVSILPYRFGTHSGWLEACRDVGTRVVAPTCGFYRDQWDEVVSYRSDEQDGLDEAGLADAVRDALLRPPPAAARVEDRLHEVSRIRAAHTRIYAELARARRTHA